MAYSVAKRKKVTPGIMTAANQKEIDKDRA
jgi:hypothetical protein